MKTKLFTPITIRNLELKNRIVMAPMCMYSVEKEDGIATDWHFTHYESRAIGQVGLIMLEATGVTSNGRISNEDLGIWSDEQILGLKEIVHRIHKHGSKAAIQLNHAGRKARFSSTVAPSSITHSKEAVIPKELTVTEIKSLVNAFLQAANRAMEAGFDCIELHAAHGYLIHQFLSPLSNTRTDEYGGSRKNRFRFLREIIEAIRAIWDGVLMVRISATDYLPGGLTVEDHCQFAKWMKELDVDLIDVSTGGLLPATIPLSPGYQVPYTQKIKGETNILTGAVGLINDGTLAEQILQENKADVIFIGRALLRNPYWPLEAAKKLNETINIPKPYLRGW